MAFFNDLRGKLNKMFSSSSASASVSKHGGSLALGGANKMSGSGSTMMTSFTYILFAVILLIIGVAIYIYYVKPMTKPNSMNTSEVYNTSSTNGNTNQAELIMFYADWCPHCKSAKPEWNNVKSQYNGKVINGYTVTFTEVNCTTETPQTQQLMDQYKVEGFPTIKSVKGNQVIDFDAKPTSQSITQFLNSVL
jgi:thiol-disulfide isomerase/thioredoxin